MDSIEIIQIRMEEMQLNQIDLVDAIGGKAGFGDFKSKTQIERRYDVQFEQKIESINGTFN